MKRRSFLKGTITILAGLGASRISASMAVPGPIDAFSAESVTDVLAALFGNARAIPSDAVRIEAPLQATKGKAVSLKVLSDLGGVAMIAIVTANNLHPLNTYIRLFDADGYYSTRIKMERSSMVTAYIKTAGGSLYSASTHIKVGLGGYGTHAG